jgi:hypothetical protein
MKSKVPGTHKENIGASSVVVVASGVKANTRAMTCTAIVPSASLACGKNDG